MKRMVDLCDWVTYPYASVSAVGFLNAATTTIVAAITGFMEESINGSETAIRGITYACN